MNESIEIWNDMQTIRHCDWELMFVSWPVDMRTSFCLQWESTIELYGKAILRNLLGTQRIDFIDAE